jgi:hypothetical protein
MKYNKDHIDIIIKALEDGSGRVRACKAAHITYQTFINWLDKVEFLDAVKKAESIGEDKIADICKQRIINDPSWQSAAWWLERNFPDKYRNRSSNDVSIVTKDDLFPTLDELKRARESNK